TSSDGLSETASISYTVAAPPPSAFDDEFNGSSIDPTLWNTHAATSGKRFCADTPDSETGVWIDISGDPSCHGLLVAPPYGSIDEGGGVASFDGPLPYGNAFGYVVAG